MEHSVIRSWARTLFVGTFAAMAAVASAHAAGYPDRPVTLIVPYPPAGTTDIAARELANIMQEHLGQGIVVENRPGGSGAVGMSAVASSKADGYTLGLGTIGTQSINEFLYKDRNYDPGKNFTSIALVMTTPNIIAVRTESEIKDLADLISRAKAAKAKGQELSYGTPGVGSSVHLGSAYFEQEARVDMLHVPFRGAVQSIPAAIGGQVDMVMDNLPSSLAQVKDGSKLRGIAITGKERSPAVPDIPTIDESGLPGFDVTAWFALYAPAGTPQDVVDVLIKAARASLESPALKEKFTSLGAQAGTLFGEDLVAFEKKERERWSALISARNITVE